MIHIKPPEDFRPHIQGKKSVFLAGSIEMGKAERWQDKFADDLSDMDDVVLLNPRRKGWNASWEQSIDCPEFRGQVDWELDALEAVDLIVMYFQPNTKSPISLLEFGLHAAKTPDKIIVCCPDGFWRKGNVDITCAKYGVTQVDNISELTQTIRQRLLKL